jgi:hypothetical protein
MKLKRLAVIAAIGLSLICMVGAAQTKQTYKARLSPVPADARTRALLAGTGSVTATLEGSKLSLTGSFEGFLSPATTAELHNGVAAGVRGALISELTIAKAMGGTITGSVDLTPPQLTNLQHGGLYIEIHSEKAPDGVLWGWLLK